MVLLVVVVETSRNGRHCCTAVARMELFTVWLFLLLLLLLVLEVLLWDTEDDDNDRVVAMVLFVIVIEEEGIGVSGGRV